MRLKHFPILLAFLLLLTGCGQSKEAQEGFEIENNILVAYTGDAKEIMIPDNVTEIACDALSWDYEHGTNLQKVTVPGTVKVIDERAFAFTAADTIIIEEGVEEIGDDAFMDSYIEEIHFPSSVIKIGSGIMETEEGLSAKIYCVKGSPIAEYFEKEMPYGECELIYE